MDRKTCSSKQCKAELIKGIFDETRMFNYLKKNYVRLICYKFIYC